MSFIRFVGSAVVLAAALVLLFYLDPLYGCGGLLLALAAGGFYWYRYAKNKYWWSYQALAGTLLAVRAMPTINARFTTGDSTFEFFFGDGALR